MDDWTMTLTMVLLVQLLNLTQVLLANALTVPRHSAQCTLSCLYVSLSAIGNELQPTDCPF
jgi:hypothetical protein